MKGGDQKQFRCTHPGCDKVFNRRDYLERHATNHLPVKPYVCVQCDRHFSRKDLFDNHLSTKRHARVVHEVEHNGAGPPALMADLTGPAGDDLDDAGIDAYDAGKPRAAAAPVSPALPGVPPHAKAAAAAPDDRSYFVYSLDQLAPQIRAPNGLAWGGDAALIDARAKNPYTAQPPSVAPLSVAPLPTASGKLPDAAGGPDDVNTLSGFVSWPPGPSAPRRRSSASSRPGAPRAALPSPTTETLEEMLAKCMAEAPADTFADLREHTQPVAATQRSDAETTAAETATTSTNIRSCQANEIARIDGDFRYAWFFDDSFDTDKSKYGYDLCYSEFVDACATRAAKFGSIPFDLDEPAIPRRDVGVNSPSDRSLTSASRSGSESSSTFALPSSPTGMAPPLPQHRPSISGGSVGSGATPGGSSSTSAAATASPIEAYPQSVGFMHPARAALLLSALKDFPTPLHDDILISNCLEAAWKHADDVRNIVHQPTFDGNTTINALLGVLLAIGLALTNNSDAARRLYPSVYLLALKALREIPVARATRLDNFVLQTLQAFCLLLRYERLILGPDAEAKTFTRGDAGRHATNRFLWVALSSVPHTNQFPSPFSHSHVQHQPIWSTSCTEAFLFHQGVEPEAQWREWALLEAAKRTVHLAVYCDSTRTFIGSGEAPVSLFNLDIQMVSSDHLWRAANAHQFFHIAGPSGALAAVPYLGLIKALIRFPRVAQTSGRDHEFTTAADTEDHQMAPWGLFALQAVAHGLMEIVGRLSGLFAHEEEMLEAVVRVRDGPGVLSRFDSRVQARLYRGLDVWLQNFHASYGSVGQQPFSPASGGTPVPQYAMLMILCHYASFIYVHEDVPIVRQVTVNMKTWFEARGSNKSLQMLLDYLYMPLYIKWIRTDEAKSIVSASSVYLAWVHAVTSQVPGGANYLFLSAMIYISTIAVWLYDFASNDSAEHPATSSKAQEKDTLRLDNYQFMDDAITYLSDVHASVANKGPPPAKRSVHSVILLSACMLYRRRSTNPLVEMLIEILSVMELGHTSKELIEVVKGSEEVYRNRLLRTIELKDYPRAKASTAVKPSAAVPATSDTDGESDMHMSDIEMSNQLLSPTIGHPMIA